MDKLRAFYRFIVCHEVKKAWDKFLTEKTSSQQEKVDLETLFKNLETLTSEECCENAEKVRQSEDNKCETFVTFLDSLVSFLQRKPQTQEPTNVIHTDRDKYREAFLSFLQSLVCVLQHQLTAPEHNSPQQNQMEPTELFQTLKTPTSEECYQNAVTVFWTEPDKYMEPFVTFLQSLVDDLQHKPQTVDAVIQNLISFLQSLVRALQSQLQTPGPQPLQPSSPREFAYNARNDPNSPESADVPGPSTLPNNNTTQNKGPQPLHPSRPRQFTYNKEPISTSNKAISPKSAAPAVKPLKAFLIGSDPKHGTHLQFLDQLNSQRTRVLPTDLQQCDVILLFCPIRSRIGSDVETAVSKIPDGAQGKPVILVLMHHTRKPDEILDKTQWSEEYPCINHEVRVLYHETQNGLLQCPRNQEAVHILHSICDSYAQELRGSVDPLMSMGKKSMQQVQTKTGNEKSDMEIALD